MFNLAAILLVLSSSQIYTHALAWEEWHHGRVRVQDVAIHFQWAGKGPPVILVHGFPQHSLTWHTIGPILTEHYTVICMDNRGMGASTIPPSRDYTSATVAEDIRGVMDFLKIDQAYVVGHDKGAPPVAALAYEHPSRVKRIVFAEMLLPAFGFEDMLHHPKSHWDTYQNWNTALYLVPEVAAWLVRDKLKELLTWYFWHGSYSGNSLMSHDHMESYTRSLLKPGYLEAGFGYFQSVWKDGEYFNTTIKRHPLKQPILAIGGEANFSPYSAIEQNYRPVGTNVEVDVVPHAGHWLGEENPQWTARRLRKFFSEDPQEIASVDLSWTVDKVVLQGQDIEGIEMHNWYRQASKERTNGVPLFGFESKLQRPMQD